MMTTPVAAALRVHDRAPRRRASCAGSARGGSSASAARSAARSTCRRAAPARPTACRPTEEVELPDTRHRHHVLRRQRAVLRAADGAAVRRGLVLLDGADIAVHAPHPGVPGRATCAWACGSRRCGCRATQWGPTLESIDYFRPTGEPDAPYESLPASTSDGSRGRRRRRRLRRRRRASAHGDGTDQRGRDAHAGHRRGARRAPGWPRATSASRARARRTTWPAGRSPSSSTLDASAPWPPIPESHVEMDGAWALYEAWVQAPDRRGRHRARLRLRQVVARATCAECWPLQLDPYCVAPLWPDSVELAALQARLGSRPGSATEEEMAEVAARSRAATPRPTRTPS